MLDGLIHESVSMATDHERYRNIKDSFDNYHQKLELDNVNDYIIYSDVGQGGSVQVLQPFDIQSS